VNFMKIRQFDQKDSGAVVQLANEFAFFDVIWLWVSLYFINDRFLVDSELVIDGSDCASVGNVRVSHEITSYCNA